MSDNPNGEQARAQIGLDSRQFVAGVRAIIGSINELKGSMNTVVTTSQRTAAESARNIQQFDQSLQSLNRTAVAVTAAIGGIAFVQRGLGAAQNIRQIETMFNIMSGGAQRGAARMQELRELADATGQSFLQVAQAASSILPAVARNNVNLAQTVQLAQRLAFLDPAQGVEGAAFAIREILGGSYTSLASRFELSKTQLRELVQEAKGSPQAIIDGLDAMVNGMGLTNEAFAEMNASGANAMAQLQSNFEEAMGTAFMPMLTEVVLPLTQGINEMVQQISAANPELLQFGATGFTMIAALIPATAAVSQLTQAITMLKSTAGGTIALNIAVGAMAIEAGRRAGLAILDTLAQNNIIGSDVGDFGRIKQEGAESVISERLSQAIVVIVEMLTSGMGTFVTQLAAGGMMAQNILEVFGAAVNVGAQMFIIAMTDMQMGVVNFLQWLAGMLGPAGDPLRVLADQLSTTLGTIRENAANDMAGSVERLQQGVGLTVEQLQQLGDINESVNAFQDSLVQTTINLVGLGGAAKLTQESMQGILDQRTLTKSGSTAPNPKDFTDEQVEAYRKFSEDMAAIDQRMHDQLLAEEQQYQERRSNMIADYEERLSDMAEDEAVRRQRAQAQLNKQIAEINKNLAKQEKESKAQLDKTIADERQAAAEKEANDLQKHLDDMNRMREDHDRTLANAARRLDARAVIEENERYSTEQSRAEADYNKQKELAAKQLEEQIAQQIEAHNASLEEARRAAAEQIAELQANFAEQERLHEEDRQRQLQRMAREQQQQLAAFDQQHQQRIAQINAQAAREREARNAKFAEEMNQLGGHMGQMLAIQKQGQAAMESALFAWWNDATKRIGTTPPPGGAGNKPGAPPAVKPPGGGKGFSSGGYNPATGNVTMIEVDPIFHGGASSGSGSSGTHGGFNSGGVSIKHTVGRYAVGTSMVPITGNYRLEQGEAVMRADAVRMANRIMGGLNQDKLAQFTAGVSRQPVFRGDRGAVSITNSNNFGDVGSHSMDSIANMVVEILEDLLDEALGNE